MNFERHQKAEQFTMKPLGLLSLFCWATIAAQSADTPTTHIPIDYKDVNVSLEMPARWANSEFGFHRVPTDIEERLAKGGDFVICRKDLEWSRSFFRGTLGIMIVDITLTRIPEGSTERSSTEALRLFKAKADFRYPRDIYAYHDLAVVKDENMTFKHTIDYVGIDRVIWGRVNTVGRSWNGIPTSETLVLGLDRRTYLRIDLGVSLYFEGSKGESWQKAALYWQNKIIESIRVTGLKQILTGEELTDTWRFPAGLEYAPELLKN